MRSSRSRRSATPGSCGIHSYLSLPARPTLRSRGTCSPRSASCFVQIGDENVHLVRVVMDEVFGSENFVRQIAFSKTTSSIGDTNCSPVVDYVLWYARDADRSKYRQLYRTEEADRESDTSDTHASRRLTGRSSTLESAEGRPRTACLPVGFLRLRQSHVSEIASTGNRSRSSSKVETVILPAKRHWSGRRPRRAWQRLRARRPCSIWWRNTLVYVRYFDDFRSVTRSTTSGRHLEPSGFGEPKVYVVQTNADGDRAVHV